MKSLFKNDTIQWSFVIIITVTFLLMQNQFSWIKEFPKEYIVPLSSILNLGMNWLVEYCVLFCMCICVYISLSLYIYI